MIGDMGPPVTVEVIGGHSRWNGGIRWSIITRCTTTRCSVLVRIVRHEISHEI